MMMMMMMIYDDDDDDDMYLQNYLFSSINILFF